MNFYFPLILVILLFVCGIIWLFDKLFFIKQRKIAHIKEPWYVNYARSFFPIILIVLIIRSFIVKPMVVPSGSLEPTILTKEYLVINMYKYGLRLPITHIKIFHINNPKRGELVVFRFPGNPNVNYIKRVIGVPGDHIVYKNKILYINSKEAKQTFIKDSFDAAENNHAVEIRQENLNGIKHLIYVWKKGGSTADYDLVVPDNMYFMMGDNRDSSGDSRFWGFVPDKNLVGKAELIWMSWDNRKHRVRWSRLGRILYNR